MEQLELPGELVDPFRIQARAEIVRLQAAGHGTKVIAEALNQRGIPTPSGRGRWWPSTVYRFADTEARLRWNAYMRNYLRNR